MRIMPQWLQKAFPPVLILLTGLVCALSPARADSTSISADGACSINIAWEQGTGSRWYIELQREGQSYITQGIAQENDAEIRYGLNTYDWGFAHQGADGSFTGTWDPFHSTALFVESAAYVTILLKNYHPKTYTLDKSYYDQKVAAYTAGCKAAADWLMLPDVATTGQSKDAPYVSRYYILAALFGEVAQLTGNSAYAAAAVPYATSAMALQLPNGVNPELGGFDVEYQEAGVLNAAHYYTTIVNTNPVLAKQINNMMKKAMVWESKRVDVNGNVHTTGSTRVGIEANRDGSVKQIDTVELEQSLMETYQETRLQNALVAYERLVWVNKSPSSSVVALSGSCDYNTDWEQGKRSKWNVALQRAGVCYVEYGIQREDDAAIRKGLGIIDWAFAHQASDGTFTGTSTQFISGGIFLESAARAALALQEYHPVTYSLDQSYYSAEIAKITAGCQKFAQWMTKTANASAGKADIATSTCDQYAVAAALQETGVLTDSPSFEHAALAYVQTGLKMQQSGGINPENGAFDLNNQALGIIWTCYFYQNGGDATSSATGLIKMLGSTLNKEASYVGSDGTIDYLSPNTFAIQSEFDLGGEITGDQIFSVIYDRLTNGSLTVA